MKRDNVAWAKSTAEAFHDLCKEIDIAVICLKHIDHPDHESLHAEVDKMAKRLWSIRFDMIYYYDSLKKESDNA